MPIEDTVDIIVVVVNKVNFNTKVNLITIMVDPIKLNIVKHKDFIVMLN